jgi:pyrimidine-nucleoside phosphorylase
MTEIHPPLLIEKKRDGGRLTPEELRAFVAGFVAGSVTDAQMAALAMAIFFRGLDEGETAVLTAALRDSGEVFSWPEGTPPKVDKHSTGGVGDKVSLVLAPLLACDELWVPMVSGRGLGITGGTLDKLESIPGFEVRLPFARALAQLEEIGVFLGGQSETFCPADRKLYALRDVTGTVPSPGLIVASIMGKKLAENLDRLVLDVKFGSGAFMKTRAEAEKLAAALQKAGTDNGVRTSYLLQPMEEPLGGTVGNALEVGEALQCLEGKGPPELETLVLDLAEKVSAAPREKLQSWLDGGQAREKFARLVEKQGGRAADLDRWEEIHPAPVQCPVTAPRAGTISAFPAGVAGAVVVQLGGGRARAEDAVDFAVGLSNLGKVGDRVTKDQPLCWVHARTESAAQQAVETLRAAIEIREP